MNLADPELELVDPTPNVHMLFIHFDKTFFWTKLSSRAVVRWSKRMYSCAGTCSYDRGGLCDIALSEPLLKLRPRKDLVETLLHEMIHAFLFVTNRDQDRGGHGPNFKQHMYRINKSAGLNISIYHDFHDEVKLYQTHWWRCNGPCQTRKPHFGIVRRPANRAPGPSDFWFEDHKRKCGGTFIKFKEPEKGAKKSAKSKPNSDITKYITNNIKTINNNTQNDNNNPKKAVLKDTSNVSIQNNVKTKSNSSSTVVVTKKGVVYSPAVPKAPTPVFTGNGQTIGKIIRSNTIDVTETVRNVWANKQLVPNVNKNNIASNNRDETASDNKFRAPVKIKSSPVRINSPPAKIKKINDYFKTAATSVLKELYGEDFKLTQRNNNSKLIAVTVKLELVDCPICSAKVNNEEINRHVDECLNKDVIEKLSKSCDNDGFIDIIPENNIDNKKLIDMPLVPAIKNEKDYVVNIKSNLNTTIDLTIIKTEITQSEQEKLKQINFEKKALVKFNSLDDNPQILNRKRTNTEATRKSESFVTKQRGDELKIKTEAGTSISDEFEHVCPCCGKKFDKPIQEHLDECLMFFDNNTTVPEEAASTSFANNTIVIDDEEDMFDESLVLNATGTKTPCPCCMKMVEQTDMNDHLDVCLQS